MPEEAEEGFTVRDRRRFLTEETTSPEEAPASEAATAAPARGSEIEDEAEAPEATGGAPFPGNPYGLGELGEDADEEMAGDGSLPDIYSVLALFLGELRNLAWLRMGLVANPGTGQIERDMAQAKVAIDTVAFLASQLEGTVPPEERLPLRALVSDLQINFVEQSKR